MGFCFFCFMVILVLESKVFLIIFVCFGMVFYFFYFGKIIFILFFFKDIVVVNGRILIKYFRFCKKIFCVRSMEEKNGVYLFV